MNKKMRRKLRQIFVFMPFMLMIFLVYKITNGPEFVKCIISFLIGFMCCICFIWIEEVYEDE